ncbi:site-specific integrase [Hymenobacter fodinae]|uniref:Uncharacterized protein n=1 Tax=Hymenobacter fodinae TaxID=2510796 RepID=A0A4Z0P579_9BACT|nr:site-specific integrase [Hymenobacter fodinae]TGE05536.1 hypothetical protein EU556_19745 [Hymenobacter fodinae]
MITYEYNMKEPYLWRRANRAHATTDKAPIILRIEIIGYERAEFATGVTATTSEWNQDTQRLQVGRGASKEEQLLVRSYNNKLIDWIRKSEQVYDSLKSQGHDPTPAEIREVLRGSGSRTQKKQTLLDCLELLYTHLSDKERQPSTLTNARLVIGFVKEYLAVLRKPNLPAVQVDRKWCRALERWCIARPMTGASIRKYISFIIRAVNMAIDEGWLKDNKLAGYRYVSELESAEKRYLTQDELNKLRVFCFTTDTKNQTLDQVRDLFVFCCYTGLSFVDYVRFARTPDTFLSSVPNKAGQPVQGIGMSRQKIQYLGKGFWVPLFPVSKELLFTKYARQLPIYESSYVNENLKHIARLVDLSLLDLSHKDARSTFAQMMRDQFGLKLAAEMAGHTEAMANARYSSASPQYIIEQLSILGAPLTHN